AMKRWTQIVNSESGVIQFRYDASGNRIQLIDANGNITTSAYDADNRLTNKSYADARGVSFSYDQAGLLNRLTNARGIVTTYSYDANHNLLSVSYSDGTPNITNTYDSFGRLLTV